MEYKGSSVYDQNEFFTTYLKRRNRKESPNHSIEEPVFNELLGKVIGKNILDLGCGDGRFGQELVNRGCAWYLGVDDSANMMKVAKANLEGVNGDVIRSSLEDWEYREEAFDLVISRLVFHYIKDLQNVLHKIQRTLRAGGRLVFSVQHPVLTSSMKSAGKEGKRSDWIVDDYFKTGKRTEPWIQHHVVKYHRTFEDYFYLLQQTGFRVTDVREGKPSSHLLEEAEYERRTRIPLFLMFACEKRGS
ncbi:methyltransferase [Halobacillus andaensis]|uniref:Methyltransferase n=1 Tax=Halobacillus andaensis TaxID=1176239 RepID=A0A917EY57_HALAA|nr:class I SAM-dependent methyltransferase [Halobacillus andaensis]MBP2006132.1 SAM-dependent methyltransferase [Halobacillus andaensis]GGF23409.1 methyltransferase [Halobacillus andaensis]